MTAQTILIALALGILVGFLVAGILKAQLKTVRPEYYAANYVKTGSLNLTRSSDIYLFSNVTRVPKPKNDSRSNK